MNEQTAPMSKTAFCLLQEHRRTSCTIVTSSYAFSINQPINQSINQSINHQSVLTFLTSSYAFVGGLWERWVFLSKIVAGEAQGVTNSPLYA